MARRPVKTLAHWFPGLALLVALVVPAQGWAASQTATLSYERAEGAERCPSERSAREGIAAQLGYDPFVDDSSRNIRVELRARSEASGYEARVEIESAGRSETGVRTLESADSSCDKLARTLMFTVSVAIDPGAASRGRREQPRPGRRAVMAAMLRLHDAIGRSDAIQQGVGEQRVPEAPPESKVERNEDPGGSPDSGSGEALVEFRADLGAGVAFGTGPRPSPLLRIGAELGKPRWAVRFGGRSDLPTEVGVGAGRLTTALLAGTAAVCGRLDFAFGCARTAMGRLRLTASGFEENRSIAALYAGVGAGTGVEFPLSERFRWRLEGQVLAALARTQAVVDDEVIWETPDLSGSVTTSIVVDF